MGLLASTNGLSMNEELSSLLGATGFGQTPLPWGLPCWRVCQAHPLGVAMPIGGAALRSTAQVTVSQIKAGLAGLTAGE